MLPDSSKGYSRLQIVAQGSCKVEAKECLRLEAGGEESKSAIPPDYSTLGPSMEGRCNSLGDKAFF